MGDGLTRAATDVGSSVQTLSPVIRGRCREGLPSERDKTASRSGPRSCQPGCLVGLGFRRRFKSSRPDYVAVAEHSHCVEVVHLIWEFYRYCRARIARRCRRRRDGTRRAESRHVSPEPHPPSNMEPDAPLTLETTARNHGPVVAAG